MALMRSIVYILFVALILYCVCAKRRFVIDDDSDFGSSAIAIDVCFKPNTLNPWYYKYTCSDDGSSVTKRQYTDAGCTSDAIILNTFTNATTSPCNTPLFECDTNAVDEYAMVKVYHELNPTCTDPYNESYVPHVIGCYCDSHASSFRANCTSLSDASLHLYSDINCGTQFLAVDIAACHHAGEYPHGTGRHLSYTIEHCQITPVTLSPTDFPSSTPSADPTTSPTQKPTNSPTPYWNPTCNGTDSSVTFRTIQDSCDHVANAAKAGLCSSKNDLIWPRHCGCPYCSCSLNNATEFVEFEQLISRECIGCLCGVPQDETSITELVYQCESVLFIDDAYNWNDFQCPPSYCTDHDNMYSPGEGWSADGTTCDNYKYCYCNGDGIQICAQGFDVILRSSISNMKALSDSFYRDYDENLIDCLHEPDRAFAITNVDRGTCDPICDCGTHLPGDAWYTEYKPHTYSLSDNVTVCAQCRCVVDDMHHSYAFCTPIESYITGTDSCPTTASISCHTGDSYTTHTDTCHTNAPSAYCRMESEVFDRCDGDTCWDYGCSTWNWFDALVCAAYANDECIYSEQESSLTGDRVYDFKVLYCCSSDNCTVDDISVISCSRGDEGYGTALSLRSQCSLASHEANDTYKEEYITCASVKELILTEAQCSCQLLSHFYDAIVVNATEWRKYIENLSLITLLNTEITKWNEALGCNMNLKCDLHNGIVIDSDPTTRPTIAIYPDSDDDDISAVTSTDFHSTEYEITSDLYYDTNRDVSYGMVGGIVGGIVFVVFIGGIALFLYKEKQSHDPSEVKKEKDENDCDEEHNNKSEHEVQLQLSNAISLAQNEGVEVNNNTLQYS